MWEVYTRIFQYCLLGIFVILCYSYLTKRNDSKQTADFSSLLCTFFFSYNDSTKQLTQAKRISVDRWEEENELHTFSKNKFAFLLHNTFHNHQNKNFNAV
jgi:hypothetical protein